MYYLERFCGVSRLEGPSSFQDNELKSTDIEAYHYKISGHKEQEEAISLGRKREEEEGRGVNSSSQRDFIKKSKVIKYLMGQSV